MKAHENGPWTGNILAYVCKLVELW